MTKAKVLFSLTELCSVPMWIFGHMLSGIVCPERYLTHKNHGSGLLSEDFLMLLPTFLSFREVRVPCKQHLSGDGSQWSEFIKDVVLCVLVSTCQQVLKDSLWFCIRGR